MRRIAIFTDIHGNYDALQAICADIQSEKIDEIYHLGDAIAIGPEPREVLDFFMASSIIPLKGNHEGYYLDIMTRGTTSVHEKELIHQNWVAQTLGPTYMTYVNSMKYAFTIEEAGCRLHLCHYPYVMEKDNLIKFYPLEAQITKEMFSERNADAYIYGHHHAGNDFEDTGVCFMNLKSAGATVTDETYYLIVELADGAFSAKMKAIPYNRNNVVNKLEKLNVPELDFIKKVFFGVKTKNYELYVSK